MEKDGMKKKNNMIIIICNIIFEWEYLNGNRSY